MSKYNIGDRVLMRLIPITTGIMASMDGLWISWKMKQARSLVTTEIQSSTEYSSAPVRSWISVTNQFGRR
jgi:hypothetical protein